MSEISSQKEITSTDGNTSKIKNTYCIQCNKHFSTLGNLHNHIMTIHENKRPYKCFIQIAQNLTPLNQDSKFTIEFMYDIFYYYRQEQSHSFAKNVAKLSMRKAI